MTNASNLVESLHTYSKKEFEDDLLMLHGALSAVRLVMLNNFHPLEKMVTLPKGVSYTLPDINVPAGEFDADMETTFESNENLPRSLFEILKINVEAFKKRAILEKIIPQDASTIKASQIEQVLKSKEAQR